MRNAWHLPCSQKLGGEADQFVINRAKLAKSVRGTRLPVISDKSRTLNQQKLISRPKMCPKG